MLSSMRMANDRNIVDELIARIELGDVDSFLELVKFVEDNYRKMLYTFGMVELNDYVILKSCTYVVIDKELGFAYALVNDRGELKVVSYPIDSIEDAEALIADLCYDNPE